MSSGKFDVEVVPEPPELENVTRVKINPIVLLVTVFVIYIALAFIGGGLMNGISSTMYGGGPIPWQYSIGFGVALIVALVVIATAMGISILKTVDALIV